MLIVRLSALPLTCAWDCTVAIWCIVIIHYTQQERMHACHASPPVLAVARCADHLGSGIHPIVLPAAEIDFMVFRRNGPRLTHVQMLCVNESERISISGIKAHPWYSEPLTERLQSALDEIYNKQSLLHSWVEEGEAKVGATSLFVGDVRVMVVRNGWCMSLLTCWCGLASGLNLVFLPCQRSGSACTW